MEGMCFMGFLATSRCIDGSWRNVDDTITVNGRTRSVGLRRRFRQLMWLGREKKERSYERNEREMGFVGNMGLNVFVI